MIKLNLARNSLKYIIRTYGIKEIFIPFYCCDVVWKACRQENCRIKFYHIDDNFYPKFEFPNDAYVLYINYFGLCDEKCLKLAQKYPNLIVDNTQSFYSKPIGLASFSSLRKFFLVENGSYLFIKKYLKENFEIDKLKYSPVLIHQNYEEFVKNELLLDGECVKLISNQVEDKMLKINFEQDKFLRRKLFKIYAKFFDNYNLIKLPLLPYSAPYCYPFFSKNKNILSKLSDFTLLKLWKNDEIIALPLNDEKYAMSIIESLSVYS